MRVGWALHLVLFLTALRSALGTGAPGDPYPPFFESAAPFREAIAMSGRESSGRTDQAVGQITGVTVPHHLLAADLIAGALRYAAGGSYERILLLTPDHYRRSLTVAATTTRPFRTPLGEVPVDGEAALLLCGQPEQRDALFSLSNLFSHEHGVHAILPFLAHWFPGIPVLPVALDARSRPADWAAVAQRLEPLVTPRTLVVQSTDFSHYLSQPVAAQRDAETLRLLSAGEQNGIAALDQPAHLDSKAAQWIQMWLQRRVFGCGTPLIVDNRNAIRYGGRPTEPRTTSYITQLYSRGFIPAAALPGEAWFFGGDTHFGRHIADAWGEPGRATRIREAILELTGRRPLVVNLEGVLVEGGISEYEHPMRIRMPAGLVLEELCALGVRAVSLANNHSLDGGKEARQRMAELLWEHGIAVADEGVPLDLGRFRLGVASDVANRPQPARNLLTKQSFAAWVRQSGESKPLFAFLHAGEEGEAVPGDRVREVAGWAEQAGASLILGAHPHRPSPGWERSQRALRFYSLGNLVFDQLDPDRGGGLVEVRFFEQGTWAARWLPLGNLYLQSRSRAEKSAPAPSGADAKTLQRTDAPGAP